jgi:hypothetical protein
MSIQFRELRAGHLVQILNKSQMTVRQGKVVNVGSPYPEPVKPGQMAPTMNRLIDITIEAEGQTQTYAIPETSSITFAGDIVLSIEADSLIREVQAMRSQSEQAIASFDMHKQRIGQCDAILEDLDTSFREKRVVEERLSRVEGFMEEIRGDMKNLLKSLS